jgi:hypothetical protein
LELDTMNSYYLGFCGSYEKPDVTDGTILEIQNVLENDVIILCRGHFGDIFSMETLNVAKVVLWRYTGEGLRSLLNSFHRLPTSEQT